VPVAILERKLEAAVDPKEKQEIKFQLHRLIKVSVYFCSKACVDLAASFTVVIVRN
jgi:hypothetical protein